MWYYLAVKTKTDKYALAWKDIHGNHATKFYVWYDSNFVKKNVYNTHTPLLWALVCMSITIDMIKDQGCYLWMVKLRIFFFIFCIKNFFFYNTCTPLNIRKKFTFHFFFNIKKQPVRGN